MNSKEEAIKKAYGEFWNESKDNVDRDGWIDIVVCPKGFDDVDVKSYTEAENNYTTTLIRPKSLKGIENNNGWIKIENKGDLPKTDGHYWVIRKDNIEADILDYYTSSGFCNGIFECVECTHWQPIQKPNPPIF